MGIEWFRDLSITILGFTSTAVLIFIGVMVYGLYRIAKPTLLQIKAASKIAYDTVVTVQDGLKPVLTILAIIKGISGGFQNIGKMFVKESKE